MARMIPQHFDSTTTTAGEARVFDALRALSDSYTVLHSLMLAQHVRQDQGEADFVIIGPPGILCLEVKGGNVSHRDGRWVYVDHRGRSYAKAHSPYTQAADNVRSVRRRLEGGGAPDSLRRCTYASGVILPDVEFDPRLLRDSSVIGQITLMGRRGLDDIEPFVGRCFDYWRALRSERDPVPRYLNSSDVEWAAGFLRGSFDFVSTLGIWLEDAQVRIHASTNDEVERYLAQAFTQPRVLLTGAAGTGKTVLSREYARRRAAQGERVLFLCYNHNLHTVLRSAAGDQAVEYAVFHDHLSAQLAATGAPVEPPPPQASREDRDRFYRLTLPEHYLRAARSSAEAITRYDCLVVDEGQDLIAPLYLECLDQMLNGGLRGGRWHICHDPDQNIYNQEGLADGLRWLEANTSYWPLPLVVNCRNTQPIAAYTAAVTGFAAPPIARMEGYRVESLLWRDPNHQIALLRELLLTLIRKHGIARREIVLLSLTGFRNSCLGGNPGALGPELAVMDLTRLAPGDLQRDCIKFCTAQGFKGLEAPVIVLLDVTRLDSSELLNTALSRARTVLYVLYHADLADRHAGIVAEYEKVLPSGVKRLPEAEVAAAKPPRPVRSQPKAPTKGQEQRGLVTIRDMVNAKESPRERRRR